MFCNKLHFKFLYQFTNRSTAALSYFPMAEIIHLNGELFGFVSPGKSLVAVGLLYQQLAGDPSFSLYYRYRKLCRKLQSYFINN